MFLETQYSDWIPVPTDRTIVISKLVEGKKFQTRTDKKIDGGNDIRWIIQGATWLTFTTGSINAAKCNGGYAFTGGGGGGVNDYFWRLLGTNGD